MAVVADADLTPEARRFIAALQLSRARRLIGEGRSPEEAADEATRLAQWFARAMREGFIAEIDGRPCLMSTAEPRVECSAPSGRQLRLGEAV